MREFESVRLSNLLKGVIVFDVTGGVIVFEHGDEYRFFEAVLGGGLLTLLKIELAEAEPKSTELFSDSLESVLIITGLIVDFVARLFDSWLLI